MLSSMDRITHRGRVLSSQSAIGSCVPTADKSSMQNVCQPIRQSAAAPERSCPGGPSRQKRIRLCYAQRACTTALAARRPGPATLQRTYVEARCGEEAIERVKGAAAFLASVTECQLEASIDFLLIVQLPQQQNANHCAALCLLPMLYAEGFQEAGIFLCNSLDSGSARTKVGA